MAGIAISSLFLVVIIGKVDPKLLAGFALGCLIVLAAWILFTNYQIVILPR